ncbi:MAG: glycine cleavage system aminomethyltransferase GcvT [Dehalococcoidia bacterium]
MTDVNGAIDPAGGLRRLALHASHARAGARFARFAGWEMPLQYRGIVAEHEAVRYGAGVFDISHLGRVWLVGPEAGARLRSVTTFDVTSLEAGRAHYSLYCNEAGGIEDDVFAYRVEAERWLVAHNAANAAADFERVRGALGGAAEEATGATVMLAVQGPRAPEVLTALAGDAYASLRTHECVEVPWRGASLLVARTGYTGEDGGEVVAPVDVAEALWEACLDLGATPAGLGARDTLRLEAALPLHGNDINATTSPYEAGLGFAVSLDDGAPFIGRGALATFAAGTRERRLACIRADERGAVFRHGAAVLDAGGQAVSELTSGAYSPSLRVSIGMAYLPAALASPGTRLAVDVRGRPVAAEVVRRPFYRATVRKGA